MNAVFLVYAGFTAANGTLTVAGVANVAYTYDIAENNDNGRTLQGFSTSAQKKMRVNGNGAFYDDFQKFLDYYGDSDYSDKFALAALAGNSLSIGGKTFDFSSYDFEARAGKCCRFFPCYGAQRDLF